jgi:hypothetical protein
MRSRWKNFRFHYLILLMSVAGCAMLGGSDAQRSVKTDSLRWVNNAGAVAHADNDVARLQFIGAGGFHLAFPKAGVLVDPFYSNPGLLTVASLRSLAADTKTIDRYLPPLDRVEALLVGHAHFDHALDVPYIATKLKANTRIYGSTTVKNSLAATLTPDQFVDVEPNMSVDGYGGRWLDISSRLRVFPIRSNHAPQLGFWLLASGNVEQPQRQLPRDAIDWRSGENVSYLLDLLDDEGRSVYRVFIQTSASSFPNGLAPDAVLNDGKSVDMAVLCAASYEKMKRYPEYLLERMVPQKVVLVHWEKFWTPYEPGRASPLPGLNLERLYTRIKAVIPKAEVSILQRGAVMTWHLGSIEK